MSAVSSVNLKIQKGTTFEETFVLTDETGLGLNLKNSVATSKLRKYPTAGLAYTFSTTSTVSESTIKLSMTPSQTSVLPSGRCYYDILVTDSTGIVTKVIEGNVIVEETSSL
jgi:hypothetical protein